METIDNYLDAMFSTYAFTPEAAEAKAELRAMMEDIYNGAIAAGRTKNEAIGQALSEFGSIEEVASNLELAPAVTAPPSPFAGAATSGNSGAPFGTPAHSPSTSARPDATRGGYDGKIALDQRPAISIAQAENFAAVYQQTRWMLAWGVAILVTGPIPLISLSVAASDGRFVVSPAVATIIGFVVLLSSVAIGVGSLVWRGQKLEPFTLITHGTGRITPAVEAYTATLKYKNSGARVRGLVIGIALWILAALPIISAGVLTEHMAQGDADRYIALGLAGTLVLVAGGLLAFLSTNWANAAAARLSASGLTEARAEHGDSDTQRYPVWVRAVMASYWPLMVAVYLAWSFPTAAWDVSWVIWPIGGALFGVFAAAVSSIYPQIVPTD